MRYFWAFVYFLTRLLYGLFIGVVIGLVISFIVLILLDKGWADLLWSVGISISISVAFVGGIWGLAALHDYANARRHRR